jgi:hypothetical protein
MNDLAGVPYDLFAPPRLSRSQVTQKVGARGRYPRPAGVVVPGALIEICRKSHLPGAGEVAPASSEGRRQMGREVVQIVARALRRLPQATLELEMPHPRVALALAIEDRTRNAIERLLPLIGKQPTWTVARYLEIPQFGARCLVDLLAALQESTTATD